jgi:flagellin-like protein
MTHYFPRFPMRDRGHFRGDRRGLAEIVGTLMLVLIVVAAATAFSYFVAAEEQTNLAEQTALHDKNLENVTIQSVMDNPPLPLGCVGVACTFAGSLVLVVASSDIYATNVTDIAVGGDPATTFCQTPNDTMAVNCAVPGNVQTFAAAGGNAWLNLTPFTVTAVTLSYTSFYLQPFVFSMNSVQVQMGTLRGNTFVETLFPPVPEIGLDFLTGFPILDGSQSYQPHTGSSPSAAIVQWVWTVVSKDPNYPAGVFYYGQEAQLPYPFITSPATQYTITLNVTNTIGLSGTASEVYTTP